MNWKTQNHKNVNLLQIDLRIHAMPITIPAGYVCVRWHAIWDACSKICMKNKGPRIAKTEDEEEK